MVKYIAVWSYQNPLSELPQTPGWSAEQKLACTGLSLGKKSRLSGRILRVGKVAQADANEAKPLARAEVHAFPQ